MIFIPRSHLSSKKAASRDPMLPLYIRTREERARVPEPVEYQGRRYDVMGMSPKGELLLRDQRAVHQDMRVEHITNHLVMLDRVHWRVIELDNKPTTVGGPLEATLRLIDPHDSSRILTVTGADINRVRFCGVDYDLTLGPVKHGIVRMSSAVSSAVIRVRVRPGQRFEARLRKRELYGPYTIRVAGYGGQLTATRLRARGRNGGLRQPVTVVVKPAEIARRYVKIASVDFGASFDVDAFIFREDKLRGRATGVKADLVSPPIQDPLLGKLPSGTMPLLTNGVNHLAVLRQFIRIHTHPDIGVTPRRLTLLNLSVSNQGQACGVLDALIEFRRQNPDAIMSIVASKLGTSEYQSSIEYSQYLRMLAHNDINVDTFTGTDGPTRQVMHAKAIVIDNLVLFTTGAIMDTQPIDKADFSIELPPAAAAVFQRYTLEAVLNDASVGRRAELAAELASYGVLINDPIASLTYISRAQDALIRGASHQLLVSVSELVDPDITRILVQRAAAGVDIVIQVRELDLVSAKLLKRAIVRYPHNLRLEDTSWWEPRPHFNAIVIDGCTTYLGTSYFWPTQRNMVHQGRSLENGVLLEGDAAANVRMQINDLRVQAYKRSSMAPITAFSSRSHFDGAFAPLPLQTRPAWCVDGTAKTA